MKLRTIKKQIDANTITEWVEISVFSSSLSLPLLLAGWLEFEGLVICLGIFPSQSFLFCKFPQWLKGCELWPMQQQTLSPSLVVLGYFLWVVLWWREDAARTKNDIEKLHYVSQRSGLMKRGAKSTLAFAFPIVSSALEIGLPDGYDSGFVLFWIIQLSCSSCCVTFIALLFPFPSHSIYALPVELPAVNCEERMKNICLLNSIIRRHDEMMWTIVCSHAGTFRSFAVRFLIPNLGKGFSFFARSINCIFLLFPIALFTLIRFQTPANKSDCCRLRVFIVIHERSSSLFRAHSINCILLQSFEVRNPITTSLNFPATFSQWRNLILINGCAQRTLKQTFLLLVSATFSPSNTSEQTFLLSMQAPFCIPTTIASTWNLKNPRDALKKIVSQTKLQSEKKAKSEMQQMAERKWHQWWSERWI